MKATVAGLGLLCVVVSALAVEKFTLDNRIRKLTLKFELMQLKPEKRIPDETLRQAQGIILLERTKAGFIFAFQGGSGVAMVRDPQTGGWGPSAFVSANEASLGVQVGGQHSFVVMLLMTTNATRLLTEPNFEFGGEASGTARDTSAGVEGVLSSHEQAVLIYDDRQGLYGGVAIKGGSLSPDTQANRSYYGQSLTMRDILFDQKVKPAGSAVELAQKIDASGPQRVVVKEETTAAPETPSIAPTNVAVAELQLLLADLNARHQTNALKHLNSYLSAMITSQHTSDAEMTLAILERLRSYRTAEAMEVLEFQLDGAVIGLGDALGAIPKPERPTASLETLQRVREYRARFPRKADNSSLEHRLDSAWSLLNTKDGAATR